MSVRIYLCGSIKKGSTDNRSSEEFWTTEHEDFIKEALGVEVDLLNPAKSKISRKDYFVNFGCDIFLVKSSVMLFADLRSEKGIGVGAEIMYARQAGIPVIAWLPPSSHYRRDLSNVYGEDLRDWIHPFAFALSDYIEDSLELVCDRAIAILQDKVARTKGEKGIDHAIEKFLGAYPEFRR